MTVQKSDTYRSLKALAAYSGLSVRTLRSLLIHTIHPLPHFRLGGKILVRASEFDQWMQQFAQRRAVNVSEIVDDLLRGR